MNKNVLRKRSIFSTIIGCIAGLFLAVGISSIIDAISMDILSKELNTILALFGIGIVLNLLAIIINKKNIYKVLVMSTMIMGLLLVFITLGFIMGKNAEQVTLATILFNGAAAVVSFGLMKLFAEFEKNSISNINSKQEVVGKKYLKTVCNLAISSNLLGIVLLAIGKVPTAIKLESVIYQIGYLVLNSITLFGVKMHKRWAVYGLIAINLLGIGIFIWAGYSIYAVVIPFIGVLYVIYMFRRMWNEFG